MKKETRMANKGRPGDIRLATVNGRLKIVIDAPKDKSKSIDITVGTDSFPFMETLGSIQLNDVGFGQGEYAMPDKKHTHLAAPLSDGVKQTAIPKATVVKAKPFDFERDGTNPSLVRGYVEERVRITSELPITVRTTNGIVLGAINSKVVEFEPPTGIERLSILVDIPTRLKEFKVKSLPADWEVNLPF